MVHARGYNDWYDHHYKEVANIDMAMFMSQNVIDYASIFAKHDGELTDYQMSYALQQIAQHKLERSDGFWDIILPVCKK